jgi:hypothetical protein
MYFNNDNYYNIETELNILLWSYLEVKAKEQIH